MLNDGWQSNWHFTTRMKNIWITVLLATVCGCAGTLQKSPLEIIKSDLLQLYTQTAIKYEKMGNLLEAHKNYKLALTVDPKNQQAIIGDNRLEKKLFEQAEQYYQEGIILHNQGRERSARYKFLTALKLWQDHPDARKMLNAPRKYNQYKTYIEHVIKSGESLSGVAKIYYGDYHKFPIIARYNGIADATQINVGQKIRVPKIEEMPFLRFSDSNRSENKKKKEHKKPPVDEAITIYKDQGIEFFNEAKYKEAIIEFEKVINANPDDANVIEYLAKSHFQCGVTLFEKKDYLKAKKEFEMSFQYNSNCPECQKYITECKETYMEFHYKKGIAHFEEEQLTQAVVEWKLVETIKPNYKQVAENIKRAKKFLKRLEEIKECR